MKREEKKMENKNEEKKETGKKRGIRQLTAYVICLLAIVAGGFSWGLKIESAEILCYVSCAIFFGEV